jgi:hypothetical protein
VSCQRCGGDGCNACWKDCAACGEIVVLDAPCSRCNPPEDPRAGMTLAEVLADIGWTYRPAQLGRCLVLDSYGFDQGVLTPAETWERLRRAGYVREVRA